jgi:hypothetical protein
MVLTTVLTQKWVGDLAEQLGWTVSTEVFDASTESLVDEDEWRCHMLFLPL